MADRKRERRAEKAQAKEKRRRIINIVGTSFMGLVVVAALYAVLFRGAQRPSAAQTEARDRAAALEGRSQADCPKRTGGPWEFDAESQCHFDPTHGHWHLGRPPSQADRFKAESAMPAPGAVAEPEPGPADGPQDGE